ncbi:MAG TPA: hypothetical protein VFW44_04285 [Bryobacteraceae bacterium]|nr:hypothetical protein [Bryobacteraceae bacterium]
MTSGSLPPGLVLSPSGILTGTFTQGGNFAFTVSIHFVLIFDGMTLIDESVPVPFDFTVSGYIGPPLTADPGAVTFNLMPRAAAATQSVTLTNHTGQAATVAVTATASSGGGWLTASAAGPVAAYGTSAVAITADPSQLAPGTYAGTVSISSGAGSPLTVSVLAVVTGTQPNLVLSQTGLFFNAVTGGASSGAQTVAVLNSGTGTLNFNASANTISGGPWLSVSSSSGSTSASSPGSVKATVNAAGLQPGTYYGKILISSSAAADSPQTASVVLNVVSPQNSPGGSVSPAGLVFVGAVGSSPAVQNLTITNPSPSALSYLITPFSNGSVAWLSTQSTSGSITATQPATVGVQVNTTGLTSGVYIGDLSITLLSSDPTSVSLPQSLHVEVLLIVLPAGSTPGLRAALEPHATTCTPKQLLPVFTLLGTGFSASAGWPTELEVTVVDDCGNPLTSGSVTATFSSGDPALSLISIGGGSWTATWNATNVASNVTITALAEQVKPALSGKASIGGALQPNAVPTVATGGIVSAANFLANQPLAPGSFGAIFGANLSSNLVASEKYPLSLQLGETSVVLAGEQLPLLFASGGQINMVVPYDIPVNSTQQLVVQTGTVISVPQQVVIAPASPAVLTQNQAGTGAAIVQAYKPDGMALPLNSPVKAGDVIVLYCSGLGAVNPSIAAGSAAPLSPLSHTVNEVTVTIGGKQQKPAFSGLTPTYAQLYQVNVTIPSGLPSGDATVTLSVAGQQSAPVTIAIQ